MLADTARRCRESHFLTEKVRDIARADAARILLTMVMAQSNFVQTVRSRRMDDTTRFVKDLCPGTTYHYHPEQILVQTQIPFRYCTVHSYANARTAKLEYEEPLA